MIEEDFPHHTEVHDGPHGKVFVRVERTFYAVDENGNTIDGPLSNLQDAIDTGNEFKEKNQ